ncbi:MAG: fibrobacter succinogenes major paralogous domain-containing protein [Prevotellaceae bacterium]|jgi:uncharacterized protein (TIGR02145 family)|nr:fibrobacter succinogenes major paralogous domain-containing protein [Prevotellaceae bacterium]
MSGKNFLPANAPSLRGTEQRSNPEKTKNNQNNKLKNKKHEKILTIIMLCGVYCGYAQTTPPYAANTRTWTFGKQKWSGAIQIPACNKETFENSDVDPQCRSYTQNGKTYYYYNWPYVEEFATVMCPAPWHVPTYDDFNLLINVYTTSKELIKQWGLSGNISFWSVHAGNDPNPKMHISVGDIDIAAYYWSSTANDSRLAAALMFDEDDYFTGMSITNKSSGALVRCVCDLE